MSGLTKDVLTASLANPGTDYLAPVDEINKAPKETMFFYTDTKDAARTEGKSNCKKRARINTIRHVLAGADYTNKDSSFARAPDELNLSSANTIYEPGERNLQHPPFDIDAEIKIEKQTNK